MKTSAFGPREVGRARIERLLLAVAAALALAAAGCNEGHEGDRCVAALSHNDCANSDLVCGPVPDCPETYCCPASGMSSNAFCQPGCAGGALGIIFASCTTATPSPLCPCILGENYAAPVNYGPLPASQYPPGVDCSCVATPDPIACLAMMADGGTEDGGFSTDGASAESSSTDGASAESSSTDGASAESSPADGASSESSTVDAPAGDSSIDAASSDASGQ
ncbi:MAG: hypothetical protein ABSF69_27320 [Polyangiaceae bacterium]